MADIYGRSFYSFREIFLILFRYLSDINDSEKRFFNTIDIDQFQNIAQSICNKAIEFKQNSYPSYSIIYCYSFPTYGRSFQLLIQFQRIVWPYSSTERYFSIRQQYIAYHFFIGVSFSPELSSV